MPAPPTPPTPSTPPSTFSTPPLELSPLGPIDSPENPFTSHGTPPPNVKPNVVPGQITYVFRGRKLKFNLEEDDELSKVEPRLLFPQSSVTTIVKTQETKKKRKLDEDKGGGRRKGKRVKVEEKIDNEEYPAKAPTPGLKNTTEDTWLESSKSPSSPERNIKESISPRRSPRKAKVEKDDEETLPKLQKLITKKKGKISARTIERSQKGAESKATDRESSGPSDSPNNPFGEYSGKVTLRRKKQDIQMGVVFRGKKYPIHRNAYEKNLDDQAKPRLLFPSLHNDKQSTPNHKLDQGSTVTPPPTKDKSEDDAEHRRLNIDNEDAPILAHIQPILRDCSITSALRKKKNLNLAKGTGIKGMR